MAPMPMAESYRDPDAAGHRRIASPTIPCSQCGGPVPLEDGVPWVTCGHCRVPLAVDVGRLLIHGVIRPVVRERDLAGTLERWMRQQEVSDVVVTTSAVLEFRPYYFVSAVDGTCNIVEAAPDLESPELSVAKAAFDAGRIEPFSVEALGTAEAVLPVLLLDDVSAALPGSRASEGTQVRLVHVPLWRAQYRVNGMNYSAVVDGVLGTPTSLALPPAATTSLDRSAFLTLCSAIVLSTLIALWLPARYAILIYVLAGVAAWIWHGVNPQGESSSGSKRRGTT